MESLATLFRSIRQSKNRIATKNLLDRFFNKAYEALLAKARQIASGASFDEHTARDWTHNTLLIFLTKHPQIANPGSVWPWLLKVLNNEARQAIRNRNKSREIQTTDPSLQEIPSNMPNPSKLAEMQESRKQLNQALDSAWRKLTPKQKQVIRFRYVENRSITDIAIRMHMNPEAIKKNLFRARKVLKLHLKSWISPGILQK